MIAQEERQRTSSSQVSNFASSDDMAFAVKNTNNRGNFSNFLPEMYLLTEVVLFLVVLIITGMILTSVVVLIRIVFNMNQNRERPFCTACKINGHAVDTCYKLHGYPPGYQPRSRFQSNTQSNVINQISLPMPMTIFLRAWTRHNMNS